jgi:hypothetical protein
MYNYIRNIKVIFCTRTFHPYALPTAFHRLVVRDEQREMHNDSVQSMEYTITNPLFSAILLASISPTVPTGMVQWVFACLFVSHLLCTPILYLSHLAAKYNKVCCPFPVILFNLRLLLSASA